MTVRRMDHVGIVVDDLAAATAFFEELGLEPQGEGSVEGDWVDRIVGLEGVQADLAMMQTPDGNARVELVRFRSPPARDGGSDVPSNVTGLRHLAFQVDDLEDTLTRLRAHGTELVGQVEDYGNVFRLCYVRGPAGVIVELAQPLS